MKVIFVVLLLTAAVMAGEDNNMLWSSPTAEKLTSGNLFAYNKPDCEDGKECVDLCKGQCFGVKDELCIDGSCFCTIVPIQGSKRRLLTKGKRNA